jgi:hypothetical protein
VIIAFFDVYANHIYEAVPTDQGAGRWNRKDKEKYDKVQGSELKLEMRKVLVCTSRDSPRYWTWMYNSE